MKTALASIEEVYNLALNPELDYYTQLEPLATNGELANHNSSLKVLLALCKLVDKQGKEIAGLQQDIRDLTTKADSKTGDAVIVKTDPTQPLV